MVVGVLVSGQIAAHDESEIQRGPGAFAHLEDFDGFRALVSDRRAVGGLHRGGREGQSQDRRETEHPDQPVRAARLRRRLGIRTAGFGSGDHEQADPYDAAHDSDAQEQREDVEQGVHGM
ncbi:hypothetical protein GCM10029992_00990 [Glycomyces albus]